MVSVCDMTTNVGTEAIHFAYRRFVKSVVCYETDPDTFEKLKENLDTLPSEIRQKITPKNESSVNDTNEYNIILCDPPWGGADYKGEDKKEFGEYRY